MIRVHLKGTFLPLHHAGIYWRLQSKAGRAVDGRVMNTTSATSGFFLGTTDRQELCRGEGRHRGMTIVAARRVQRQLGITVDAIAPRPTPRPDRGARTVDAHRLSGSTTFWSARAR